MTMTVYPSLEPTPCGGLVHWRRPTTRVEREQEAAILAESYAATSNACNAARRHGVTPRSLFTFDGARLGVRRQRDEEMDPHARPGVASRYQLP